MIIMFQEERKIQILNILNDSKSTSIEHLAKYLKVSPSTIRRDLTLMEKAELIKRSHGGAILTQYLQHDYDFNQKKTKNYELKKAIGKHAATLVEDGDVIALNSSTITTLMAEYLTVETLTVVTNSINILNIIIRQHSSYQIIVLGGVYIVNAQTVEGPTTIEQISRLHFDKVFFGVNGINAQFGLCTTSELEAKGKIAMLAQTNKSYCLAENAKFGRSALYPVAPLSAVDSIITDWQLDPHVYEEYSKYTDIQIAHEHNEKA